MRCHHLFAVPFLLVWMGGPACRPPSSPEDIQDLLDGIRDSSAVDHPYLGTRQRSLWESRLGRSNPRRDPDRHLQALVALGNSEVATGRIESGIRHLTEARDFMGPHSPASTRAWVAFHLGAAHFRLGETENCCTLYAAESCILPFGKAALHQKPEGAESAIRFLLEALAAGSHDPSLKQRAVWMLNLAHLALGASPGAVPSRLLLPPEMFQSRTPFPRFANIAPGLGVATNSLAGSSVSDDFDRDGDPDLIVTSWDSRTSGIWYFENLGGDQGFHPRTEAAGLSHQTGGLHLVHADYDNDGDLDVLVLRGGWLGNGGRHPNSLYQNQGKAVFRDVTREAGLGGFHWPSQTAAWADYDNDGDLDLYCGNESTPGLPAPSQLFQNLGDGTFLDVADAAGVTNDRMAKGAVWGDVDHDRWPDLIVSNFGGPNRLYHNRGDGTFEDIAVRAGVSKPIRSFPLWVWDLENDGHLDIFISSYAGRPTPLKGDLLLSPVTTESIAAYRGNGRGQFTDVGAGVDLDRPMMAMGCNFGDLDNDGWLDFYLGTGDALVSTLVPNRLYMSRDRGTRFADVTMASGMGHLQKGHGVSFADFDNDGDLDVFEQMGGAYPVDAYRDALYRNPGFGNHWLAIRLEGNPSNRDGIGARIRVVIDAEGESGERSIYRTVSSGASFGGNPLLQHIGLGQAEVAARIEVFWPRTGKTQILREVPANQTILIREGL